MDLRDLENYDLNIKKFHKISTEAELVNLKEEARLWLKANPINPTSGKKTKGLYRYKGKRFINFNGKLIVLTKSGKLVNDKSYKTYMQELTRGSGIPRDIWKKLQSDSGNLLNEILPEGSALRAKYPEGFDQQFRQWFKKYVGDQKSEQQFWRNLGELYVDAGLEKDRFRQSVELDRSHYWPRSKDGIPFTFLENWLVNQSRGAKEFYSLDNLRKAGIPTTWDELIETVYKEMYEKGPDGVVGTWTGPLGPLNAISNFDAGAMVRGESPEQIIARYAELDEIQERALLDPRLEKELQPRYAQLLSETVGPENAHISQHSLSEDIAFLKRAMKNEELKKLDTSDFDTEVDSLNKQNIPDEFKTSTKFSGGAGPGTNISPNPPKSNFGFGKKVAAGLTIGGAASAILPEVGLSAVNRKTGKELGILASGEGDMSNVKGAVQGIGEDLVGGAIFSGGLKGGSALTKFGWKKALQMAGKKGVKHFGGKYALAKLGSKAVPYVGWGLLGYGLYDTADAFVEGLTKKGISERIGEQYNNIIEEAFSPENSFFKQRKVKPENDIQGTL